MTKYLNPNTTVISGNLRIKIENVLAKYISYIKEMIDLGATLTQILEKIKNKHIQVHHPLLEIIVSKKEFINS
ncbi:hypothetical protein psyc5s11_07290 [Clostridium gelidum]|uniref:Uncharacterized protein n=1 Tax=Clostridium gelidum TaxID=704125 RepID=A0ABN6IR09_9CLOT|nr:hypothetical protein [Clostridium gelidum]BCZ44662.1 hypothetical protein psyc5s11_07290 [Clostridium gelidum]